MSRRALLIGSATAGLTGMPRDLDILTRLLENRGFEIARHEQDDATRDAIVAALQHLAENTATGDAAVVYYSGHGCRVRNTGEPMLGVAEELACLVPFDFAESTESDFRGLTALELSALMAAVTRTTRNATVILDCCFAGQMSRTTTLTPKSWPEITYAHVADHLRRTGLIELGRALPANVVSNPDLVRLVAAGPVQEAAEFGSGTPRAVGVFTAALDTILTAAGDTPLTWTQLVDRVRRRVQILSSQRPEAEGPANRLLFSTDPRDAEDVLSINTSGGVTELGGGVLNGVGVGDIYAARDGARPAARAALLTVTRVGAATATVTVALEPGVATLPAGAEAHPLVRANRRRPVTVTGTGAPAELVTTTLAASKYVRPADPADELDPPLLTVRAEGDVLTLLDAAGPVTGPYPATGDGATTLVRDVDRLARAAAVRTLDRGDVALDETVEVEWGHVEGGEPRPLPPSGGLLFESDKVYLRLRNRLPVTQTPELRFLFAFSVDAGGRIGMISNASPSGIPLANEKSLVLGLRDEFGTLQGFPSTWPERVLRDTARPETVLVISTSATQDLQGLAQDGIAGSRSGNETRLQELLLQIADGGPRSETAPSGGLRYAVRHLDYLFVPADRPPAERSRFALDERPDLTQLLISPPGEPAEVTVHLEELVLAADRVPGAAGVRLDALALSVPEVAGTPTTPHTATVHTATWRASAAGPGAALTIADRALAVIAARERLHLALWISPDAAGAPDLADLVDAPPAVPGDRPRVVAAAAAQGVAASVVDQAAAALAAATGASTGLYRSCWPAGGDFGAGIRPTGLSRPEPGLTLRLRVEAKR